MCIAIINALGTLDETTFHNCWESNPHGGGLAYVDDGQVKILKEMDSVSHLYRQYSDIRKYNKLPMIIHFRVATSGDVDENNCHPFEVMPGLVMAHNGIIEHVDTDPQTSDTRAFISQVLSKLPEDFLLNVGIRALIRGFIDSSRLVFLNKYGVYDIINEHMGHWDKQRLNWFSNYTHLPNTTHSYAPVVNHSHYCKNSVAGIKHYAEVYDQDEMGVCESCGNWYYYEELIYDESLQAAFCEHCIESYMEGTL